MYNIIEIIEKDEFDIPYKSYFKNIFVDSYGNIKFDFTENPLHAQKFSMIENMDSKDSIVKLIKNIEKTNSVSVKTLEVIVK